MADKITIVTGYFGAPIRETAEEISSSKGYKLLSLDDEIEKKDGRSVRRICMMMGEHEYRNKEYELLEEICRNSEAFADGAPGIVVMCGDGVLYDEMSRDIILKNELVIVGRDMNPDELWYNALGMEDSCHAFMFFGSEDKKRESFDKLYLRHKELFDSI